MTVVPLSLLDGSFAPCDPAFADFIEQAWIEKFALRDFEQDPTAYDTYDVLCYSTDFSATELSIAMGLKLTGWIAIMNRVTGKTFTWQDIFTILDVTQEERQLWAPALKQQTVISNTETGETINLLSVQLALSAVRPEHKDIQWLFLWGDAHALDHLLVLLNRALSREKSIRAPIHWFRPLWYNANVYIFNRAMTKYNCVTPVIRLFDKTKAPPESNVPSYIICRYLPQHELKVKTLLLSHLHFAPFKCLTSLGWSVIDPEH